MPSAALRASGQFDRLVVLGGVASASFTMRWISSSLRPELAGCGWCFPCQWPCPWPTRADAVGVDVEGDLDLRHAARCGRNVGQVELARLLLPEATSRSPCSTCTVTRSGCRRRWRTLRGLGRNRGVLRISLVITPPRVSMPETAGHVEQQHVLHLACSTPP